MLKIVMEITSFIMENHRKIMEMCFLISVGTLQYIVNNEGASCCCLQGRLWITNPDQFVEDEDDDTFSYSVRISAQDLLLVRLFLSFFR